MLNLFTLSNGRLQQITVEGDLWQQDDDQHLKNIIWVDVEDPTPQDLEWVQKNYNIDLPNLDELEDIEASARFFIAESGELHLRSNFLLDGEDNAYSIAVGFVVTNNILFSIHAGETPVFRLVRLRGRMRPGSVTDCRDVLLDLYTTEAEYCADSIEDIYRELGEISTKVLTRDTHSISDDEGSAILLAIARQENINGYIRRNMMDTRRALSYLLRGRLLNSEQQHEGREILQDIDSIYGHTAFLFDKINFLLDTIVGFLNINQNRVIKIFSVASVAMLPPTLIASIYGMNFGDGMPELAWGGWGYALALCMMATSIAVPMWYFRKRGWLRF